MTFAKRGLFILSLISCAAVRASEPQAAEFRNGHWQAIAPVAPVNQPDAELDHMQQLLNVGDGPAALNVGLAWVKSHPKKAPQRDRALLLIAQARYKIDGAEDWIKAYYYCDELMDEYPESPLFFDALQLQFTIADGFLRGHLDAFAGLRFKFLGVEFVGRENEAIEMLFRIQQRSPGSPLAEKALLRTADYYYAQGEYELAHDAYGYYVKNYPRSDNIPKVKLRRAFASLAQFRGIRFDSTPIIDARAELSDIISAYPELARSENLANIITRIDAALAAKLYVTADFYRRTHKEVGAVYMYRYLIASYPQAADVPAANRALAGMPKWALAQPEPVVSDPFPKGARE